MTQRILGTSTGIERLRTQLVRAAQSESKVLILGENGTGKELVAEAIHQHSKRHDKLFVALNCAAVPESLLEAEIFGHEKGAFTGAVARRQGVFERANGGTLFLDEIGDMSLSMQAKLLRVLQSGTFERIGGHETLSVDVRVIAATNKNLNLAVMEKTFREDLYHRIAVLPVRVPALRQRLSDIPELVASFIARSSRPGLTLDPKAIEALQSHSWPGNVRQLINVVDRLVALVSADNVFAVDVKCALALDDADPPSESLYISRDVVSRPTLLALAPEAAPEVAASVVVGSGSTTPLEKTANQKRSETMKKWWADHPEHRGSRAPVTAIQAMALTPAPYSPRVGDTVRLGELTAKVVELADEGIVGVEFSDGGDAYWFSADLQRTSI